MQSQGTHTSCILIEVPHPGNQPANQCGEPTWFWHLGEVLAVLSQTF